MTISADLHYVDCDIGGSSGAGTEGDPWSSLVYALTQYTYGTRGNHLLCKGTETLASVLVMPYTFSYSRPLAIRPWDANLIIDGNAGNFQIYDGAKSAVHFINPNPGTYTFTMRNTGTSNIASCNNYSSFRNLIIHNADGGLAVGNYSHAIGCHIYDVGGHGIYTGTGTRAWGNYITNEGGTRTMTIGIRGYLRSSFNRNIIALDSTSTGIELHNGYSTVCANNSIIVDSGVGIERALAINAVAMNNLVECGASGIGIQMSSTAASSAFNNGVYTAAGTAYNLQHNVEDEDNETLTASPFEKNGALTYANRFNYFAPTTEARGTLDYYYGHDIDRGAVQHKSTSFIPAMRNL